MMTKKCVICKKEFEPAPQNEKRQKICTPASHTCIVKYETGPNGRPHRVPCPNCCKYRYLKGEREDVKRLDIHKIIYPEARRKIFATAKILDEDYYLFIRLALEFKMRIGEVVLLTPDDFEKHGVDYVAAVTALKQTGHPKWDTMMKRPLYDLVRAYVGRHKIGKDERLFSCTTRWYRMKWMEVQKSAGIPKPWNFHCLRHTGGSLEAEAAKDVRDVALVKEALRHKSLASTEVYIHGDLKRRREQLKRVKYF